MRLSVIEEVGNGFVVRHRDGDEIAATVFAGPDALQDVMKYITWYFTQPRTSSFTPSPSPSTAPAIRPETALEPRHARTPLPTESTAPVTERDVKTMVMLRAEIDRLAADDSVFDT